MEELERADLVFDVGGLYEEGDTQDVGHFHLVIDPDRLAGRAHFAESLGGLLQALKAMSPAPGHDEVLVPGEPEARAQAERERDGIPLPPTLWTTLSELSAELGVAVPASG